MASGKPIVRPFTQGLSAAAVVVSLVFVGLEVRESARQTALNTQSIQVSAYQDLISQINSANALAFGDPELRRLFIGMPGLTSLDELSAEDQELISPLIFMLLRHGDLAFYQFELGMLSEERLESALAILTRSTCSLAFQDFWLLVKNSFVSGYREFLDERIAAC